MCCLDRAIWYECTVLSVPVPASCGGFNQHVRRSDAAVFALLIFLCRGRPCLQRFARNLEISRKISLTFKCVAFYASSAAVAMARPFILPLWLRLFHCSDTLSRDIHSSQRTDTTHYSQHHHRDKFWILDKKWGIDTHNRCNQSNWGGAGGVPWSYHHWNHISTLVKQLYFLWKN